MDLGVMSNGETRPRKAEPPSWLPLPAAVNRLRLTPRLFRNSSSAPAPQNALRLLRRNSLIEASLSAIILFIVGVLGTFSPALE